MIIEHLFNFVDVITQFIFDLVPDLPSLPTSFTDSISNFINLIISYGGSFLGVFVRISTLKIVIPLFILALNFKIIYKVARWLLSKIPFDNIFGGLTGL